MQVNQASLSDGDHRSWAHVRHSAVKFLCMHWFVSFTKMWGGNKCLFCNLDTSRDIFVCFYLL